jgi:hypothetical protein
MTDQALHKLFSDIKSAPAETDIAEVSQWINTAATATSGTSTFKTLIQNKIIIMSSIITVGLIGTVLFFTGHPTKNEKKIAVPSIQKSIITNEIDSVETAKILNKKQQNNLLVNHSLFLDTNFVEKNKSEQNIELQNLKEEPKNIIINSIDNHQEKSTFNDSGLWKSSNDSLSIDTLFEGVKSLVFTGRVNDKISVHGSNRTNVAMNYNYKYKVKGIYSSKNRDCEVRYEKKDSVLTIQIGRKNPTVSIGVSYIKETSNIYFEVPENIAVKVKTSFGDIDLSGLKNNDFDFQTSFGDINASVVSGNINLKSSYGDINAEQLNGKIDINTSYGDINGKNITIEEHMNINSGYGDIDFQITNPITDCQIDLKTGFGKIKMKRTDLELESASKLIFGNGTILIKAKSGYGDIIVR